MDLSLEYKLMCSKAKEIQDTWKPQPGDFMSTSASYCYEIDKCEDGKPCTECLNMSNVFVISDQSNFVEEIGGIHWFFDAGTCNRDGGCLANETRCSVMTKSGYSDIRKSTVAQKDMIWLPRQDQIQGMFLNGITEVHKARKFVDWLNFATYNPHTYSLEMLWLMFYMETVYQKQWNPMVNVKEWEQIKL